MKRFLSILLAGLFSFLALVPEANAALSYQFSGTKYGNNEVFTAYITATANDTTTPITGKAIDNRDGRIQSVSVIANVTASTGTSPTLKVTLQGSNDGSNFVDIYSAEGTQAVIETSAQSLASAVTYGFDSCQELRCGGGFPAFLRVKTVTGGSDSPGWTGTIQVVVKRAPATVSLLKLPVKELAGSEIIDLREYLMKKAA